MGKELTRLVSQIRELEALFRSYGIERWADWLEEDASLISAGDLEGIDHLLSAYGGMGSMSDVYVTHMAGDPIDDRDVARVNSEVGALRSSIYELATEIKGNEPQVTRTLPNNSLERTGDAAAKAEANGDWGFWSGW